MLGKGDGESWGHPCGLEGFLPLWGVPKSWVNEIFNKGLVSRSSLLIELSAVESVNEQFQSAGQSIITARKTSGLSSKASKIMTQFSVVRFNWISVVLPFWDFVSAIVIPKARIGVKPIAEIPFCFWRIIQDELNRFFCTFPHDGPAQNTTGFAVNDGDYVDPVFLRPIKVNNSSISAFSTFSGCGLAGNCSACALTQLATLWGSTPKWRPIFRRFIPSTYIWIALLRNSAL